MTLQWIREQPAVWDDNKKRIIGQATPGIFDHRYQDCTIGASIPAEWWRVERDGRTVGYGWMDVVWGDAEILLATDPDDRGQGIGTFILEHMVAEAKAQQLNYVYNTVRPTHPQREQTTKWLEDRGFASAEDGSLRKACT